MFLLDGFYFEYTFMYSWVRKSEKEIITLIFEIQIQYRYTTTSLWWSCKLKIATSSTWRYDPKKSLQWEIIVSWVRRRETIWKLDLLTHWGKIFQEDENVSFIIYPFLVYRLHRLLRKPRSMPEKPKTLLPTFSTLLMTSWSSLVSICSHCRQSLNSLYCSWDLRSLTQK